MIWISSTVQYFLHGDFDMQPAVNRPLSSWASAALCSSLEGSVLSSSIPALAAEQEPIYPPHTIFFKSFSKFSMSKASGKRMYVHFWTFCEKRDWSISDCRFALGKAYVLWLVFRAHVLRSFAAKGVSKNIRIDTVLTAENDFFLDIRPFAMEQIGRMSVQLLKLECLVNNCSTICSIFWTISIN